MLSACATARPVTPAADHHQHLFSPAMAALLATSTNPVQAITARDLVALLDSAGIRIFLDQLLPLTPDVPVQIAHLAGTGPGYDDPPADSVMAVFAEAVEKKDPRTRRLWFDVATVVNREISSTTASRVVRLIRQVGVDRILYGSDAAVGDNPRPREGWALFRRLPLTEREFARIASNVAPYLQ